MARSNIFPVIDHGRQVGIVIQRGYRLEAFLGNGDYIASFMPREREAARAAVLRVHRAKEPPPAPTNGEGGGCPKGAGCDDDATRLMKLKPLRVKKGARA